MRCGAVRCGAERRLCGADVIDMLCDALRCSAMLLELCDAERLGAEMVHPARCSATLCRAQMLSAVRC
eukprot:2371203-Rhodomonas_salina.2